MKSLIILDSNDPPAAGGAQSMRTCVSRIVLNGEMVSCGESDEMVLYLIGRR